MMKSVLCAAVMLASFCGLAKNFCEVCGRDISLAKNSRRCGVCSVREPIGKALVLLCLA